MKTQNKIFLVVVPAFNEAKTIGRVVKGISKKFDVLVVDDGSKDETSKIALKYGAKIVKSKKNFGVDHSIDLGFKKALKYKKYKYVITFDADGQHSLKDLKKIIKILREKKADLVIGERKSFPRFSEKIFSLYSSRRLGFRDLLTGLKAYNLEIYKKYGTYCSFNSIGTELSIFAIKNHYKVSTIKIKVNNRIDKPRLGGLISANYKILKALFLVIIKIK